MPRRGAFLERLPEQSCRLIRLVSPESFEAAVEVDHPNSHRGIKTNLHGAEMTGNVPQPDAIAGLGSIGVGPSWPDLTNTPPRLYIAHKITTRNARPSCEEDNVMKVKPLGDRILVKMVEMESKTAGGILIPQTAQEKTQEGVVLAVGDDEAIKVKVNDRVIYDKYAGTTIKIAGEEQLILKNSDILAKVE